MDTMYAADHIIDIGPGAGVHGGSVIAEGTAGLGVYYYNLGDDNALATTTQTENCFCDACQKRFRSYLKKVYGTLDKVNKEYRTNYKSWDEIRAYPFIQSCKKNLGSQWLDFRLFMEEQFIDLHRYIMAQITAKDPEALCFRIFP